MLRFAETTKWNDPWFRKLKAGEKLIFLYLIDNCDNAGFYEIDIDMMSFQIGIESDKIQGAIEGLSRGLLGANGYLWVKNFLRHQKNWPLNPDNNAHKQIINIFLDQEKNFKGCKEYNEKLGAIKGLISPIGIGKGIGNSKGKGKKEPPQLNEVVDYFKENGYSKDLAEQFHKGYNQTDWKDSRGKPIISWKQKAIQVWFKPDNKKKEKISEAKLWTQ